MTASGKKMQGFLISIPIEGDIEVTEITSAPTLEEMQSRIGGWIERVPYFTWVHIKEKRLSCYAFCNEEGKLKGLPVNYRFELMRWDGLSEADSAFMRENDLIVGNVLIIAGNALLLRAV